MGRIVFYSWQSEHLFNIWHEKVKAFMGIPTQSHNSLTGEIDELAPWTDSYTKSIEVNPNDIRAFVDDDIANTFPDGIGIPCDPPPAELEE